MGLRLAVDAVDPKAGMTLAELVVLVRRAEALGIDPGAAVNATITWRGYVKTLTLTDPAVLSAPDGDDVEGRWIS